MRFVVTSLAVFCAAGCLAVNPYQGAVLDIVDGRDVGVYDFVLDDTYVYFGTGGGGGGSGYANGIARCRKDGCFSHTSMYNSATNPTGIVFLTANSQYLFWGELDNASGSTSCAATRIMWMAKDALGSAAASAIAESANACALTADETAVYWNDCSTGDLKWTALSPATDSGTVAMGVGAVFRLGTIDGDSNLYWIKDNALYAANKHGNVTAPTTLSPLVTASGDTNTDLTFNPGLAVDGDSVYWVSGSKTTTIHRTRKTGGSDTWSLGYARPGMMVVDDTDLYWSTIANLGSGTTCSVPGGMQPSSGPTQPPGGSGNLVQDNGKLMRVNKATGRSPETLFTGDGLDWISLDSANVYWRLYQWGVLALPK
jgi:hypothetical protein